MKNLSISIVALFTLAGASLHAAEYVEITDEQTCSNTIDALVVDAISHRKVTGQPKKIAGYDPEQVDRLKEKNGACKTMQSLKIKPLTYSSTTP